MRGCKPGARCGHCAHAGGFLLAANPNPCPAWGYVRLLVRNGAIATHFLNVLNTDMRLLIRFH